MFDVNGRLKSVARFAIRTFAVKQLFQSFLYVFGFVRLKWEWLSFHIWRKYLRDMSANTFKLRPFFVPRA
ncbi:hypothetical protein C7U84_07910 [Bradyrhizobium sp. WBAH41]|nr:hypothetical protein [Bradyrhizobium sp. WBAH41]